MAKKKCPECVGCMEYLWVFTNRYLYCPFCKQYYTGQIADLQKAENPYTELIDSAMLQVTSQKENSNA